MEEKFEKLSSLFVDFTKLFIICFYDFAELILHYLKKLKLKKIK